MAGSLRAGAGRAPGRWHGPPRAKRGKDWGITVKDHEFDDAAARELRTELRRLADTILDLDASGRLLTEAAALLKQLGDARSRVFAWEVRLAHPPEPPPAQPAPAPEESARVVDEAVQRAQEAEQEWLKSWEHRGEGEL